MPNLFAYMALIAWPLISLGFFKRFQPLTAVFCTIVGGYLLLPTKVEIDFPFVPPLDKESIPAIAALIGCIYIAKIKIALIPRSGLERWLFIILLSIPFITVMNNPESINGIPGLTYYDSLSAVISQYLALIPFLIGLQLVKSYEDQLQLFRLLVIAGLLYSLPILFEVRMSPQLHTWIYGFFSHSFGQQIRAGGFRPTVFLGHGLLVAMFVAVVLGAATLLWKNNTKIRDIPPYIIVVYFFVLLFLCKTMSAFLLGAFLLFAIGWMPVYIIRRLALVTLFVVIFYPVLSIFDLVPHQDLIEIAEILDTQRADSLAFRFHQEVGLLEHAQEKIFFGWGGWGRNRLSDSVTDGYWIILLGQYGLAGFTALFGLALLSGWRGIKSLRLIYTRDEQRLMAGHVLIVAIILVDQLPNFSLYSWLWFFIGALLGRANHTLQEQRYQGVHAGNSQDLPHTQSSTAS